MLTLILTLISLGALLTASGYAQELSPLPSDIVFSASSGEIDESLGNYRYNILGFIEAESLEVRQFYIDETASLIKPLSWSPNGNLLAILRVVLTGESEATADICVLGRSGELQICFDDKPSGSIPGLRSVEQQYLVTWSPDSTHLYFVAEDVIGNQGTYRLVEVDVSTGQTLETVYQVEFTISYYNPIMIWTPTMDQIAIGVPNYPRIGQAKVVDIKTGNEWRVGDIVNDQEIDICGAFSPLGNYLIASINTDETDGIIVNAFVVFDKEGEIVHTVDVSAYAATSFQCPTWSADESSFFIYLNSSEVEARILSYSLQGEALTEYAFWFLDDTHMAIEAVAVFPLEVSPTDTYIAFSSYVYFERITVICPDGEMLHFASPFSRARWPVWVPADASG
jgi:WD40 repeat protein